jgi:hypothetical protein
VQVGSPGTAERWSECRKVEREERVQEAGHQGRGVERVQAAARDEEAMRSGASERVSE